ncbi:hypothetical protein PLESTB_000126600 [Pleodorina starrii]|uniref:Vacuolar protein sorting-associated protein 54 n=1 Tax=Pleodorina starrii TaxID=330485 RepID=A0A9W6BAW9_9CHLO|nr:hypothetical protein PLESTB_000126600 [Pleodorina starrii]
MSQEQQPFSNGPPRQFQQEPGPLSQPTTRLQNPSAGLSSHGASRKRLTAANFDRSAYTAGQTLVTVVNDPRADAAKSWGAWLGFRVPDVTWQEPPPPIDTMRYPPVTRRDLAKYLALLSDGCYEQFQAARQSLALSGISQQLMTLGADAGDLDDEDDLYGAPYEQSYGGTEAPATAPGDADHVADGAGPHPWSSGSGAGGLGESGAASASASGTAPHRPAPPRLKQGDGLVTALQVVPPLFFNEDFSLSRPDIFEAICGCEDDSEMYTRIDKLNAALDVVETQLMLEISSRSRAIVSAGNCVHDLAARLSATLAHIKQLRENVSDMDDVTYSAAVRVARLQRRRNNLSAAVEQIKGLEEVAAAKAVLPLMLEAGDYAGALDLLDNLSHAATGLSSSGVAAFRGLGPQLSESRAVVESLLQSEMLGAAMYTEAHLAMERAVAESAQALGLTASTPLPSLQGTATPTSTSTSLSREWSSGLRSASSASSLLAAELAASREQLHDRLLPVVLGLHRCGCERLEAALRQFAANRAAEVKAIVREAVERLLPLHLHMAGMEGRDAAASGGAAAPAAPPGASGAPAAAAAAATSGGGGGLMLSVADGGSAGLGGGGGGDMSLAEKLGVLPHQGFMQILMVITSMVEAYLAHTLLVGSLVEDALRSDRGSGRGSGRAAAAAAAGAGGNPHTAAAAAAVLAAPRREVHSALQAVVDVATGRWAKLMAARSDVHSRLKVYEFRALLAACEAFAALPDSHGLRPGAALRPTLQALCRAHLESTHSRCAMQMQHLLEAEQWVPAEAHTSFQAIVDRLEERCPGARQQQQQTTEQQTEQTTGLGAAAAGAGAGEGKAAAWQRPTEGLLRLGGRHYWPVNALLMLLKLLDEHYLGLLPASPPPQAATAAAAAGGGPGAASARLRQGQGQGPGPAGGASGGRVGGPVPGAAGAGPQAASWALSTVGADVAQRCLELLRTFNTVTAQQVLGAGAMRTAGLKSISAKHLALAAQSLTALLAALPLLRWQLAAAIADAPRRALLMPEFDRLAQDLNLHVEEIHGKLVDIMQDRVLAACRQVSADSEAWARAAPALAAHQAAQPTPSEALRLLARQLGTLRSVLQPILQPEEVSYIFGRVAAACSESLAGLLDSLTPPPPPPAAPAAPAAAPPTGGLLRGLGGGGAAAAAAAATAAAEAHAAATAAWDASRRANALFMLQALAALPLDPSRTSSYVTRLATFYTKHYGLLPADVQARPPAPTAAAAAAAPAAAPAAAAPPPAAAAAAAAGAPSPPAGGGQAGAAASLSGTVAHAPPQSQRQQDEEEQRRAQQAGAGNPFSDATLADRPTANGHSAGGTAAPAAAAPAPAAALAVAVAGGRGPSESAAEKPAPPGPPDLTTSPPSSLAATAATATAAAAAADLPDSPAGRPTEAEAAAVDTGAGADAGAAMDPDRAAAASPVGDLAVQAASESQPESPLLPLPLPPPPPGQQQETQQGETQGDPGRGQVQVQAPVAQVGTGDEAAAATADGVSAGHEEAGAPGAGGAGEGGEGGDGCSGASDSASGATTEEPGDAGGGGGGGHEGPGGPGAPGGGGGSGEELAGAGVGVAAPAAAILFDPLAGLEVGRGR